MSEPEAREVPLPEHDRQRDVADGLSISHELLSAVMSLLPDAAVIADPNGRIVSVNAQAEALFDYAAGSLSGMQIESLVPERVRARHRLHRAAYAKNPESRPMGAGLELTGRRRDGSEFPLDISLATIESDGQLLVVAAVRDMTEQRAATAAQAELATIVNSSLDAIISTTLEGVILSWNPAAEDLLGYSYREIAGEHIALLVPDHASMVLEDLLDSAFEGSHRGARDTRWLHKDGHEVDVAVSISPLKDLSGHLRGFSSLVRDITERRAAEEEVQRLLREEQRLMRQHEATAEIRLALLADAPLEDALRLICERASELVPAPIALISYKEGDSTRIIAGVGIEERLIGAELPPGASLAERVIDRAELMEFASRSDGPDVELPTSHPDGPALGVPVVSGDHVAAALTIIRELGAEPFGDADRLLAKSLAAQAALAFELERARHDREEMMLVGDRERIGRDLHDHVIQRLFATGMGLQSTLGLIEQPRVEARVSEAISALDETVREIRNTIFRLSGRSQADGLLRSQVLHVAQEATAALGFEPSVDFEGPVDAGVPDELLPEVLAVVREALSNTTRHAHASSVLVRIKLSGGTLAVVVSDDGVGIGAPVRSSGLFNLEERAHELGGTFQVSPGPRGGTRLEWTVPVTS